MKIISAHHANKNRPAADKSRILDAGFGGTDTSPFNIVPAVGSPDPERSRQPPLSIRDEASPMNDTFGR